MSDSEPLSKEDFTAWKRSHATRQVRAAIQEYRQGLVDQLLGLESDIRPADITAQAMQRVKGIIYGIDYFLEMEWEE